MGVWENICPDNGFTSYGWGTGGGGVDFRAMPFSNDLAPVYCKNTLQEGFFDKCEIRTLVPDCQLVAETHSRSELTDGASFERPRDILPQKHTAESISHAVPFSNDLITAIQPSRPGDGFGGKVTSNGST